MKQNYPLPHNFALIPLIIFFPFKFILKQTIKAVKKREKNSSYEIYGAKDLHKIEECMPVCEINYIKTII